MAVTAVVMPRLGLTMEEGVVLQYLRAAGEYVQKGEPLLEVDIDKGTVVVEAQASGYVRSWMVDPGTSVPVGHVLGYLADDVAEPLPEATGDPGPGDGSRMP